jgi:hypothetical protein
LQPRFLHVLPNQSVDDKEALRDKLLELFSASGVTPEISLVHQGQAST